MQPEPQHEDVVTIMFTDVEGSTDLTTRHGDEQARRLIDLQRTVIRERVGEAGGTVRDVIGDGFMITFPSTRRAVSCAMDIQRRLAEQPDVRVRVGLHAGEVLQEPTGHPFGAAVNAAARVAAKAHGGHVLVSETVRQLVGPLPGVRFHDRGRFELKGFRERWRLYEAVAEEAPPPRRIRVPQVSRSRASVALGAATLVAGSIVTLLLVRDGGDAAGSGTPASPRREPVRAIDDSAAILPGRSIGDVAIGMPEPQVLALYGEPELVRDWTAPGKVGSILNYTLHEDLFRVYLYDGKVVGVTTQGDYYETDDGLRVGGRMPLPDDADAGITRNAARDFIWRNRYVYRDVGGGCNFWTLRGFGAVTEFIFPRHGVRRIAGIRIVDEPLVDEVPREIGLCR